MMRAVLLLLVMAAAPMAGRGRLDLLAQLTERHRGVSLLGRIRAPPRPSPASPAPLLQQLGPAPTSAAPQVPVRRTSLLERARKRPRVPYLPRRPARPPTAPPGRPAAPRRPLPAPRARARARPRAPAPQHNSVEQGQRGQQAGQDRRPLSLARQEGGRPDECDALRAENNLLKQLLSTVSAAQTSTEPPLADLFPQRQQTRQQQKPTIAPPPEAEPRAPSPPVVQTVVETILLPSFLTTTTTRQISLRFQNRWKTTQVVEAVIVTSTATQLRESLVTLVPTRPLPPSVPTVASAPLPLPQAPPPHNPTEAHGKIPRPSPRLSSFRALQHYLISLRGQGPRPEPSTPRPSTPGPSTTEPSTPRPSTPRPSTPGPPTKGPPLKPRTPSLPAEVEVATPATAAPGPRPPATAAPGPTQTVITVFLSGSVPGEYSTVLRTVAGPVRRRREAGHGILPIPGAGLGILPTPVRRAAACPLLTPATVTVTITPATVTVTETASCPALAAP